MNNNIYAVLIGINEYQDSQHLPGLIYAEKDCQDLYNILTDPEHCNIPDSNIEMLTGSEATTRRAEEFINMFVVEEREETDTILLYFSGHGFISGDKNRAYLATYDTSIKSIHRNPRAGLS